MIAPRTLLAALAVVAAVPAAAQQPPNPIHPTFVPLAADGKPARRSEDVSADATCGQCHDAKFVGAHSGHSKGAARATCIQCHVDGGRLDLARVGADGRLPREALRIGSPRAASCAACHGLVSSGHAPLTLPAAFEGFPAGGRTWSLTQGEGAIVSPQRMADSFLNLEGKEALASPWDVHAAKLVDCVGCHYAPNDPRRTDAKRSRLEYVTVDPRRASTADFLHRPDHRLAEPDCRSCHDALKGHAFLPYRERHVDVIACQTCHAAAPRGPAAEMVDATVVTARGTPLLRLRNVEAAEGEPLNAATIRPLRPLLVMRAGADGVQRLTPVNLVSRWRWISRADRSEVPWELVTRAWRDGDRYAPELVRALDGDGDGTLSTAELRLDAPPKVEAVAARLRALGVVEPIIDGVLEAHVVTHGISTRDLALSECAACHAARGRLDDTYVVAGYLPGGVPPRPPDDGARVDLAGVMTPTPAGGLAYRSAPAASRSGPYVLGHSRQAWSNRLGYLLFLAVALGVALHGGARLYLRALARRRRPAAQAHEPEGREYVFGSYERLWHWTMALAGIALMATGVVVHNAGWAGPGALTFAVDVHNVAAAVLLVNAGLSLFYHLATRAIRQFIPHPHGLLQRALEHIAYQSRGIFIGDPHPHHPGHKLNPLQQVTYLSLLGVLFPLQIATGLLIWGIGHWPRFAAAIGGLHVVAPLHNLGAWLFLAFFVLHTYLVTTGPTLGEHARSMVTGFRSVPADSNPQGA